jgi:hypothetical protein
VLKLALESPLPVIRSNRRSRSEGVIVELLEGFQFRIHFAWTIEGDLDVWKWSFVRAEFKSRRPRKSSSQRRWRSTLVESRSNWHRTCRVSAHAR